MALEHGTDSHYQSKRDPCRCTLCVLAHNAAHRAWYQEQRRLALLGKQIEQLVKESKA